jgi:peptidyl-dipeptidase A
MSYESETFRDDVQKLWSDVLPLYQQLHAYVRRKLNEQYGAPISKTGPIPAHVLGDMWSQHWSDLLDFTTPFPGKPSVDVTETMVSQVMNNMT